MRLYRIIPVFAVASLSLVGGCSNDAAVNNVVAASPPVLRDCDRLAMKVLLASYEKAGENQGRLVSFGVSSEKPAKGKYRFESGWGSGSNKKDELNYINFGGIPKVVMYKTTYFVNDKGSPSVYDSSTAKEPPDVKYEKGYPYTTSYVQEGKDYREKSKTKSSLTCEEYFNGEGSVDSGSYLISEDANKIYWQKQW